MPLMQQDYTRNDDLLTLASQASSLRETMLPEPVVTYRVGCPLTLPLSTGWLEKAEAALTAHARSFLLSTTAEVTFDETIASLNLLRLYFPGISITGLSVQDLLAYAHSRPLPTICSALRDAGLIALGGSPANPGLSSAVSIADWLNVHRAAHREHLPSIAVLTLRSTDSPDQQLAMLDAIHSLQQETSGILACEPRIERMDRSLDEVTGAVYLKLVSLARIKLPNVPHVQSNWSILGPKVLQLALRFGADDAGLILPVPRDPHIPSHHSGEEELRRIVRDAGYQPVERDPLYRLCYLS